MRELTVFETANAAFLTANDVPYGLIEVTSTGLAKSILDATQPYREFLQATAIHDFDRQAQGPDFKLTLKANLVGLVGEALPSRATLYRPLTKSGDPRIWFRDLARIVSPGQVFASIWAEGQFWVANISSLSIEGTAGDLAEVLAPFVEKKRDAVSSLRGLIEAIASRGFIPVGVRGDTAIGRLLETELGIKMNSNKAPDYRGIEIKASRKPSNKVTLFAKTPDWILSRLKSAREIVDEFASPLAIPKRLYCTISARAANPNGLQLLVDESRDRLHVMSPNAHGQSAVQWELDTLRFMLANKHDETFWVKGETRMIDGWEHIRFRSVDHTSKPIVSQFAPLVRDGAITLDFTINQSAKDHGYLFRTAPKDLRHLFPPAKTYALPVSDRVESGPALG